MKITHLVLLKYDPFYLQCFSEKDAIKTAEQHGSNVAGIVNAPHGLEVLEIKTEIKLQKVEPKALPDFVTYEKNGEKVVEEIPEEVKFELSDDLKDILNKGIDNE